MTGHLNPVRWPPADIEGIILIAVGACYGQHVVGADGTLASADSIAPARIGDGTPRFRVVRNGPALTLEGPIESAP